MTINHVPEGFSTVSAYLCVKDAARALAFYCEAFGAKEIFRLPGPDGLLMHAEFQIGDTRLSLSDPVEEFGPLRAPAGNSPVGLLLYVDQVDEVFARAVTMGATVVSEPEDQFYGDRSGTLVDPFGQVWLIATHVEDVPEDELTRRMAELA